jgi:predicted nucleic acid-binding protein
MVLIDTSVWIAALRNRRGEADRLRGWLGNRVAALARFSQLELLQGAKDEREWGLLSSYLAHQHDLEPTADCWSAAARIYFDLRRGGLTVRSPIDCCIAQLALDHGLPLLHLDQDFETIARIPPLSQARFDGILP